MSDPAQRPEPSPEDLVGDVVEDLVDTVGVAKMLKITPQSVRNAYRRATRRADGAAVSPQEAERDAALLDAFPTPGGRLRWTRTAAARILRAFKAQGGR